MSHATFGIYLYPKQLLEHPGRCIQEAFGNLSWELRERAVWYTESRPPRNTHTLVPGTHKCYIPCYTPWQKKNVQLCLN